MARMRYAPIVAPLLLLLAGCGHREPVVAHGKPVDYWLQELGNADAHRRLKAVGALGDVGTADARAIPALADAVKDLDAGVRDGAVLALLNIGPAARTAVPALKEAVNDPDPTVRSHAQKGLQRIQGGR
jgi:HEAT repeat protein